MTRKSKTLVTHVRPHLDDLCGVWLFLRFVPGFRDARLRFVTATTKDPGDPDVVFVGLGRRRFDEHKGDIGESATSLAWKYVRPKVRDSVIRSALDRLVSWVRDEDMALHDTKPNREHGPTAQLGSYYLRHGRDNRALANFGFEILDGMLDAFRNSVALDEAWKKRKEFDTPWGRGVALATTAGGVDSYAYRRGFVLAVLINPKTGHRAFRAAPKSKVDLSKVYERLRMIDPGADWFLHHSKKLLLCGSDVAPESRLSKLSLDTLVELIKS